MQNGILQVEITQRKWQRNGGRTSEAGNEQNLQNSHWWFAPEQAGTCISGEQVSPKLFQNRPRMKRYHRNRNGRQQSGTCSRHVQRQAGGRWQAHPGGAALALCTCTQAPSPLQAGASITESRHAGSRPTTRRQKTAERHQRQTRQKISHRGNGRRRRRFREIWCTW